MPELPPVIRIRRDSSCFIEVFIWLSIGLVSFGVSVIPFCKLFVHSFLVDDVTAVECVPTMMALGMCLRGLSLLGHRY